MSCRYTYKGKTYEAWEFVDVLASLPVEELLQYLPADAQRKLIMASKAETDKNIDLAVDVLNELADVDDFFRYPKVSAKTLSGAFSQIFPDVEYLGEDTRPEEKQDSKADHRFVFKTPPSSGEEGKLFYVYTTDDGKVWIDVSALKPGMQGSRIYAAVAGYAHNSKSVFVGDPKGVSRDAVLARTRMMLSSALRYGTTEHLSAAPEQVFPEDSRIEPLEWSGNDFDNLKALIHTFVTSVENVFPNVASYEYDYSNRRFVDRLGQPVDGDRFNEARNSRAVVDAGVGPSSLRSAILIKSLVSRTDGEAGAARVLQAVQSGRKLLVEQGGMRGMMSIDFNPLDYINKFFTPDQKIVGDSGREYDDSQRAFFTNVGRDIQKKSVVNRIVDYIQNDFAKKMAVGIVDQFRGLKDLGDGGQAYMLARLSKGTAGAVEALLHHGKLKINNGAYDADMSGGFIERLGVSLNGELEDVLWWIAANRAERLNEEGRENLFSDEDIASGKSLATGETNFDYTIQSGPNAGIVTRRRSEVYEDANRVFNEFNKNVMDVAEESGLIDGSQRKYWESEFYVPFYRVSEEEGEFVGGRVKNGLVRQKAFEKLKGGSDKLNSDLLHNVMMNWSHLIDASAKNRAAKASLTAAESMGVAHVVPDGTKNSVWFLGEVKRKIPFGQKYEEDGEEKISDGNAEILTIGKVSYRVDDPFVMTALTSLEYAGMNNAIMKAMSAFKHILTVGVTANPAFKVRNLIRDSVQAIATSELGYNPIKNIKDGLAASHHSSQDYVSALASGGLIRFGTMLEGRESARIRQLVKKGSKNSFLIDSEPAWQQFYDRYLEPSIAAYNELGNRSEEINRSALYKQLTSRGIDHATASLMARDLMDFSMQGAFPAIRFLTQVVPFLNARLQGLYKLGRATAEDRQRMATVIGACALISIALMMMYEDDDDWKRREDYDRDNFWWFKFAGLEVRIPKPFEVGAVASLAERSFELLRNDEMTGDRFRKVTSDMLLNNLSMNPVPQMIKPVLEVYYNKDTFTGRPIETMGMQRLDKTMRYNSQTTMVGRAASTMAFGAFSPVQFDHIVQGYFSWLGATTIRAGDMAARIGSSEPDRPTIDYWKLATQGIVKEAGTGSSRYVTFVYDQAKVLEEAYATYNRLLKDGKLTEAYQYKAENADKLSRYKAVESVKREQAKITERIRDIEQSGASSDAKRDAINELQRRRETVAKRISPA